MSNIRNYGSWPSPLTAELCTASQKGVGQIVVDHGSVMIAESRPWEKGRAVIMARQDGQWRDVVPKSFNLRTRLHEYGGLSYTSDGGMVIAVNDADQCLHRVTNGGSYPITPESSGRLRYAEPLIDRARDRVIAICEDHSCQGEPANKIVSVPLNGGAPVTLAEGWDFYAYPRLSPDGSRLAWIAWNHPNMPWDGTFLQLASFDCQGCLGKIETVAGGPEEALIQPEWRSDGSLIFLSDRRGFWNLFDQEGHCLWTVDADCGGPLWQLGTRFYDIVDEKRILAGMVRQGRWHIFMLQEGGAVEISMPFEDISGVRCQGSRAWVRGAAYNSPAVIAELNLNTLDHQVIYRSGELPVAQSYISKPQHLRFRSGGREAFANYYPPANPACEAPGEAKPPLIVLSHGGPTGSASRALRLDRQFWTSRGFAICDVDYGGSSGYGRAYRDRLKGQWGVIDVEDCVAAADYLVEQGLADPEKLIIRGGSAGGFTVLAALTFFDRFGAGASAYGIGDLELLAGDTHKFESRYLDSLIGPYPEMKALYQERSPIHHIDRLNTPVIFFQGLEDKVVPPNQAETMVAALRKKGVAVAYLPFEGEGHGFRQSETQIRVLLSELAFYAAILGLKPEDTLPPLDIANHSRESS